MGRYLVLTYDTCVLRSEMRVPSSVYQRNAPDVTTLSWGFLFIKTAGVRSMEQRGRGDNSREHGRKSVLRPVRVVIKNVRLFSN
eukprot:scaffold12357_cov91-Skeletonema_dohrnii-CCMP3373.AAC.2